LSVTDFCFLQDFRSAAGHQFFSLPFDKLRTNGSMVLSDFSVVVFYLAERKKKQKKKKNNKKKKKKYLK